MKKIYCVKKIEPHGTIRPTITFTNIKNAKKEAWKWINWSKSLIRATNEGKRSYGSLKVIIFYVDDFGREIFVKDYK